MCSYLAVVQNVTNVSNNVRKLDYFLSALLELSSDAVTPADVSTHLETHTQHCEPTVFVLHCIYMYLTVPALPCPQVCRRRWAQTHSGTEPPSASDTEHTASSTRHSDTRVWRQLVNSGVNQHWFHDSIPLRLSCQRFNITIISDYAFLLNDISRLFLWIF